MLGRILRTISSFTFLAVVKVLSHLFYRVEAHWVNPPPQNWREVRVLMLLNHTSLFEPIYLMAAPWAFIWHLAGRIAAPGADKTLSRPIVGRFWKMLGPKMIPITRKRDDSWTKFMDQIDADDVILIAPEGRMMRANGLDSTGKPMSIRGGIADILKRLNWGKMIIAYSGGLHHVQVPGEKIPRIFKTVYLNLEVLDIAEYKESLKHYPNFKLGVVDDLTNRLERYRPSVKLQAASSF